MSVSEIKKTKLDLIEWSGGVSDVTMLTALDGLKNSRNSEDWWAQLTENQRQHINNGLVEADKGKIVSPEIFWDRLNIN